jgi:alpha-glucosidase
MNATWWDDAVVYQVYLRSFADANGDGIGDLAGLRSRLGYLSSLGVDALWLNPCYASPQRDHGYDIADYRQIDPSYGDLREFDLLIAEAHRLGIRVLMDMVANHCSDEHAWFREALASPTGSAARERFLFRDGRGEGGELPPNNWQSVFGGPAWTRVADGQWYLHSFDPGQPDFNWRNPEVEDYFDDVLRFWYARGVDGFRIDVAHGHIKAAELGDWLDDGHNYSMWDQPEVHEIYRRWRRIGDEFGGKYLVGEIWVPSVESLAAYVAADELHGAFSFELLVQPWRADRMRAAVQSGLAQAQQTHSRQAWTLANHDVHRTATRYGQEQYLGELVPTDMIAAARRRGPADHALGARRSVAALMLQLALPGAVYLYQGEELGLPEVLDLPDEARQDPIWLRSNGAELGRDGCRVPLPWTHDTPAFGFSSVPGAAQPWLPQPAVFGELAADLQEADPHSPLALHRAAIHARSTHFAADDAVEWLDAADDDLLAFTRGSSACVVNFSDHPIALPEQWRAVAVLASAPLLAVDGAVLVDANSAVWLTIDRVAAAAVDGDQMATSPARGPQSHEEQ